MPSPAQAIRVRAMTKLAAQHLAADAATLLTHKHRAFHKVAGDLRAGANIHHAIRNAFPQANTTQLGVILVKLAGHIKRAGMGGEVGMAQAPTMGATDMDMGASPMGGQGAVGGDMGMSSAMGAMGGMGAQAGAGIPTVTSQTFSGSPADAQSWTGSGM